MTGSSGRNLRAWKSIFFYFFALLFLFEIIARNSPPFSDTPSSSEIERNPSIFWGWPEYLRQKPKLKDEPLIILISNSQGIGLEVQDPKKIFPSLVQDGLRKRNIPAKVVNWSVPKASTAEIEILSVKAIQRRPKLVIFVLGYKNIERPQDIDLNKGLTDIHLLAGDLRLWKDFQETVFFNKTPWRERFKRSIYLQSTLLRSQTIIKDRLALYFPKRWIDILYGEKVRSLKPIDLRHFPPDWRFDPPVYFLEKKFDKDVSPSKNEIEDRFFTFQEFYPLLSDRFAKKHVPLLWIWSPLALEAVAPDSLERIVNFNGECDRVMRIFGSRSEDLTRSLPAKGFHTSRHMNEEGHRLMAELLLSKVVDVLQ